ncbi:MAG TPA: hypothetical protein PLI09_08270 [Candidatus Hydrogenedentes bacterium]|nr:hypothetical protein [Candidatus Hydrogenedentota bacterium]
MVDFEAALSGDRFTAVLETGIRKAVPASAEFDIPLPNSRKVHVELNFEVKDVHVLILENGRIEIAVSISICLKKLSHALYLNDYFPADQPVPTTNVPMKAVSEAPLDITPQKPILLGVPRVSFHVKDLVQGKCTEETMELDAVIDLATIVATPNLAGVAQELSSQFHKAIEKVIKGVFGQTHLADLLLKITNFLDIVWRHVLEIGKLPEIIAAPLIQSAVQVIENVFNSPGIEKHIPLGPIQRTITLAKEKVRPNGTTAPAVKASVSTFEAWVNLNCTTSDGKLRPEVILDLTLETPVPPHP